MPRICIHSTAIIQACQMSLLSSENVFVSESLDGVCSTSGEPSFEVSGDSTEINHNMHYNL